MRLSTHTLVFKLGTKMKPGRCMTSVKTADQPWRSGIEGKIDEGNLECRESGVSLRITWRTATFARLW